MNKELLETIKSNDIEKLESLISNGMDIKQKSSDGKTALLMSAECGHITMIDYLLKKNYSNKNEKDNNGKTALFYAVASGKIEVVDYLLENNYSDLKERDDNGDSVLHIACNIRMLQHILKKNQIPVTVKSDYGRTLLLSASANGNIEMVDFLLKNNYSSTHEKTNFGLTALLCAVAWGHIHMVDHLLKNNYSTATERNNDGDTALLVAAYRGNIEMLEHLLEKKYSRNTEKNNNGQNALHLAAAFEQIEMFDHLLKNNYVYKNERDKYGRTELLLAARNGRIKMVEHLLKNNHSNKEERDYDGHTALHLSIFSGNKKLFEDLVTKYDFNTKTKNNKGMMAIHIVVVCSALPIFQFLLDNCPADKHEIDDNGNTILHRAAMHSEIDMFKFILERNYCKTDQRNNDGNTALLLAASQGSTQKIDFLLKNDFSKKNERNNKGYRMLHMAASKNQLSTVQFLLKNKLSKKDETDNYGKTALELAMSMGFNSIVDCLLKEENNPMLSKKIIKTENNGCQVVTRLENYIVNLIRQFQKSNYSNLKLERKEFSGYIIEFFKEMPNEMLYAMIPNEDLNSFSIHSSMFSHLEFSKEFSQTEQIVFKNKTLLYLFNKYCDPVFFSKSRSYDDFLNDLWHEFLLSNKKGKKLLSAPKKMIIEQKERTERLDALYVRLISSRYQLQNYISNKNIAIVLKKFKEKKEELIQEIDYCDNIMSVYTFKSEKERKKKPYLENNPKKREQLEELYLDALEMSKTVLQIQELFEDQYRKKIGFVQKLALEKNLEALEHIYETKFNYYKKSIEEIYEKIFGLEEEFDVVENSLKEQKRILDSLVNNINKIEQAKQLEQYAKKENEFKLQKKLDEKKIQEKKHKEEIAKRKEIRKQQLEAYLANRKANSPSQNNPRFLRFMENSTQKNNLSNNHSINNTETKHTKETHERPRFKKETLEKAAQMGARFNMEPSLVRIKYILDNPFNQNNPDTLFIETKALLYLCAHTMENLKKNHTHSVFPIEVVYKFRNALYHNMSLFKGLLGDKTKIKEDNKAIREMISILYQYFLKFQQEGSPAPKNSESSTFNLIIDSEIPNTFTLDLCKKMLNHYGQELTEIRKQQTLYPGDEVLLSAARSFIEAQAGCIFAYYEDNYRMDSEFDLYKEQFGYCRALGNKIRHGKINKPITIKKQDQESLKLTITNLSLDQYEENFPELENKSKEQKELKDQNPTQIEKRLQTGQKISWGTIHTYSNIKFQNRKEFKKDDQNENRRLT